MDKKYNFKKAKISALIILAAFLTAIVLLVHPLGKPTAVEMDNYFIKHSQRETGSNNAVSAIVFDYRGLDTLGEATVLFSAVMSVSLIFSAALLKKELKNHDKNR